MGVYLLRLLKASILSAVAVYTFINGPTIYANVSYFFHDNADSPEVEVAASEQAVINPIILPLANTGSIIAPAAETAPPTTTTSAPIAIETPLSGHATISIAKINVSVPIVFGVPAVNEKIYASLTSGVVHYSITPKPGESGASVILGHSSLYPWQVNKYGAPFALLGKLRPGDVIKVTYEDGKTYTYIMKQSIIFNPLESASDTRLAEFERSTKPLLLLVTCWPINSSTNRIAIQAELQ